MGRRGGAKIKIKYMCDFLKVYLRVVVVTETFGKGVVINFQLGDL